MCVRERDRDGRLENGVSGRGREGERRGEKNRGKARGKVMNERGRGRGHTNTCTCMLVY